MNWDVIGQLLGDGLLAAVAAIGFAVISNPPRKAIFISALLAAVGHALRFYLIRYTPLDIAMASLVAAFTIGMFSMLFAKLIHCPAVIFSFPSLLPMVPGMYAYKTVLALMQFIGGGDVTRQNELMVEFFRNGLTTLFIMFALVIGVALPVFIFHKQSFMMTRLLKIKHKDKGKTWEYGTKIAKDKKVSFNETSMYETPNGDLIAFMRSEAFGDQACIARSIDGGKTFGEWKSMGFKGHPLQAMRLPDNRVLLTYGYRHEPCGVRARILNAECTDYATAPEIIIRDDADDGDVGYTWAVQLDEKRVLVVYYINFDRAKGTRHIQGSILEIEPQG